MRVARPYLAAGDTQLRPAWGGEPTGGRSQSDVGWISVVCVHHLDGNLPTESDVEKLA